MLGHERCILGGEALGDDAEAVCAGGIGEPSEGRSAVSLEAVGGGPRLEGAAPEEPCTGGRDEPGGGQDLRFALDRAGAGDDDGGVAEAERHGADGDGSGHGIESGVRRDRKGHVDDPVDGTQTLRVHGRTEFDGQEASSFRAHVLADPQPELHERTSHLGHVGIGRQKEGGTSGSAAAGRGIGGMSRAHDRRSTALRVSASSASRA